MPTYIAPTRDAKFVVNEVLDLASYGNLPGFESATPDIIDAVIDECGRFAAEVLQPLNQVGDREGCTRHEDGSVTTPTGFKAAFDQYREGGWGTVAEGRRVRADREDSAAQVRPRRDRPTLEPCPLDSARTALVRVGAITLGSSAGNAPRKPSKRTEDLRT